CARRRSTVGPVEPVPGGSMEIIQQAGSAKEADLQVLAQLRAQGSNLSKPHHIRHYFDFATAESLHEAAALLMKAGYTVVDMPSARGVGLRAEHDMVPSTANVAHTVDSLERLAAQAQGEYEGWEAAITR